MFLNSGNFRRKVKKYRYKDINNQTIENRGQSTHSIDQKDPAEPITPDEDPVPGPAFPKMTYDPNFAEPLDVPSDMSDSDDSEPLGVPSDISDYDDSDRASIESEVEPCPNLDHNCDPNKDPINNDLSDDLSENLTTFLRDWSMQYNIRQQALKPLLQKLNQLDPTLPTDPRRLLNTPRDKPSIIAIDGGEYWHQGIGTVDCFFML